MRNCLFLLALWACDPESPAASIDAVPDGLLIDAHLDAAPLDAAPRDATAMIDAASDAAPPDAAPQPDAGNLDRPTPMIRWPWPERDALHPDTPFARRHPAVFERMSRWTTVGESIESRHARGAFGTGNGRVFALAGLTAPLNTLHGLVGPTYDRPSRFFGDYAVVLADRESTQDTAGRSLTAPVLVSRLRYGEAVLWTHDFAAPVQSPAGHCLMRQVHVDGLDAPATLWVQPRNAVAVDAARIVEVVDAHHLTTGWLDGAGDATPDGLRRIVGPDAWSGTVLHCFTLEESAPLPDANLDAALLGVLDAANTRAARRARLDLPDPMLADLLDGWLQMIDVQTSTSGAVSPLSRYTRFWTRDTMGPLLAFLAIGDHTAATRLLDALYIANVRAGEMRNSYASVVDLEAPLPVVDWANRPPLTGRVAAESPSYLVLMHAAWANATGDTDVIRTRWPWLRHALLGQVDDAGWLPFSGDETFRLALNLALGLGFEHPHEDTSWSANSSLLWLGAQQRFIALATALEQADDVAEAVRRAEPIEARLTQSFALNDGCWAALVDQESGAQSAPFEDVQLKALWAGWLDGDAPRGRASVDCLLSRFGLGPGVIQSPLAPRYAGIPVLPTAAGVRTGMLPGYTLAALTRVGHPEAFSAFAALETAGPSSGAIAEYHGAPGGEAVTLILDATGAAGDSGARFRPWEGGIVYAAALEYLFGWQPDALSNQASIRPHLPPGWPRMALRGARVGAHRVDIEIERVGDTIEIALTADGDVAVGMRWDDALQIETVDVEARAPQSRPVYGRSSLRVDAIELRAGLTRRFIVIE